jgi:hypothetical protein
MTEGIETRTTNTVTTTTRSLPPGRDWLIAVCCLAGFFVGLIGMCMQAKLEEAGTQAAQPADNEVGIPTEFILYEEGVVAPRPEDRDQWKETDWTLHIVGLRKDDGWKANHTCFDGSFVDIVTNSEAIEVDWAYKWKEGIGQASLYSALTGKRPALLLLTKNKLDDKVFLLRAALACQKSNIQLYVCEVNNDCKLHSTW